MLLLRRLGYAVVVSLSLATGGIAVAAGDFYREVVPVASQSPGDRQRAASQGLAAVLIRIAGTDQVLQNDTVREALRQADGYLEQFSYQSGAVDLPVDGGEAYQLVMEFQPEAATALLREAGLPVWSGKRPRILVWLDVNDSGGQRLVTRSGPVAWTGAVEEAARRRGLPLLLPDSAGGLAATEVASQMDAELVYIGVVNSAGGSCSSQWNMQLEGAQEQWSFNDSGEGCVAQAVAELAETLAGRYAIGAGATAATGQTVMLQVAGIGQFDDYSAVIHMLTELPAVRSVTLQGVAGDRMRFALTLRASQDSLERALALEPLLMESAPQADVMAAPAAAETGVSAAGPDGGTEAAGGGVTATNSADSGFASSITSDSSAASATPSASTLYYQLRSQSYGGS